MSLHVREWLPAEAMDSGAVRGLVDKALASWSPKWFARAEVAAAAFEQRRGAAARRAPGWQMSGVVGAALSSSETVSLAGLALGAEPERLVLSEADRDIIGRFATEIAGDLAAAIEDALGLDSPEEGLPVQVEDPFAGDGGLQFSVADHGGRPLLHIAIPSAALIPFRKSAIAEARRRGPPLARIDRAFETTAVRVEARLGKAVLPLGDLARLAAGDVVILDRAIGDGAELALRSSGRPFARGAIVPGDAEISLLLLPQQRDS
jgi:hypothetical protein